MFIIITFSGLSLILVSILGLAITFMFSLVAFAFYRDILDSNDGRQCQTAYECFTTLIHHGIVEGMYSVSIAFVKKIAVSSYRAKTCLALK